MARVLFVLCISVVAAACAEASSGNPGGADASTNDALTFNFPDANNNGVPDAPPFGQPDAPPVSTPDATPQGGPADALPPGSNLFCNTHADCTNVDECCFTFGQPPGFCVVGTEIGPLCLPQ